MEEEVQSRVDSEPERERKWTRLKWSGPEGKWEQAREKIQDRIEEFEAEGKGGGRETEARGRGWEIGEGGPR